MGGHRGWLELPCDRTPGYAPGSARITLGGSTAQLCVLRGAKGTPSASEAAADAPAAAAGDADAEESRLVGRAMEAERALPGCRCCSGGP